MFFKVIYIQYVSAAAAFFQLLMGCEAQSDSNILFKNEI